MALFMAQALLFLPLLLTVAMVTETRAAPLAGETAPAAAALNDGDSGASLDVAKRAKEEIVYGNQQNTNRLGAAKKSVDASQDLPQDLPAGDDKDEAIKTTEEENDLPKQQEEQQQQQQQQQALESSEVSRDVAQDVAPEGQAAAEPEQQQQQASGEEEEEAGVSSSEQSQPTDTENADISEPQEADSQSSENEKAAEEVENGKDASQDQQEGEEEEEAAEPVPEEGGEQPQLEEEEDDQGDINDLDPDLPSLSGLEEGGVHPAASEEGGSSSDIPAASPSQEEDEVESLLTDLQHNGNALQQGDDEGSAERELMQVNSPQNGDGAEGSSSGDSSSGQAYQQSLLNYILAHGGNYGRQLSYPVDPYFVQRRRRSLMARSLHRLPHIHRRRRRRRTDSNNAINKDGEKELSRAKRTKRDLWDDELYYNKGSGDDSLLERLAEQEAEEEEKEEEEEEKDAELQGLITYLMALYPAVYGGGDNDDDSPQTALAPQFPGYMWQGPTYPEDLAENAAEQGSYWVEPSSYQEPQVEWEEPRVEPAPASWEPSFYPEEVEEEEPGEEEGEIEEEEELPDMYPVLDKRQMMSFVPGQRRKRYFFPFSREPYTHWGAFVPAQKRAGYYEEAQEEEEEEQDPLRRLRELALVLAEEDRQPAAPAYLDVWDEYKKK